MRTRPIVLAVTGLTLAVFLAACGTSTDSDAQSMGADPGASSASDASGQTANIAYAQLMIPHHQQAVEMADLALKYGSSAEVKQLATGIKAAQQPEIEQMSQWLQDWGAPMTMPDSHGDMAGMDMGGMSASGMMSEEDLAALADARGADFDRMWLQMMIAHHQGAIAMTQQVLDTTNDPQVTTLANAVISGQQAEIATMQQLLAQ